MIDLYWYRAIVDEPAYDGDTLRLTIDYGFRLTRSRVKFRLAGIDTPELHRDTPRWTDLEPSERAKKARDARNTLRELAPPGAEVLVRTYKDGTDGFARPLADLFVRDELPAGTFDKPDARVWWRGVSFLNVGDYLLYLGLARAYM